MLHKMSYHKKKLLYALIGSALILQSPLTGYAAEAETENTSAKAEEKAAETATAKTNENEFTFQGLTVSSEREKKKKSTVVESYAGGQVAKSANLGILGNTDILDTPFNITSYTKKTIEDQQAHTLADVMMNDASVRFTTSNGHMSENFTIRGFEVNETEIALNGMYGLAPGHHVPTEFLERVEVLKGPSALLYGMSPGGAVGGTVNVVTKTADEEPLTRVTTEYTSSLNKGVHLDLGRRFGENKEWGMRINVAKSDGATGVENQEKARNFGSINLDYQGEKFRAYLDAFSNKEIFTGGSSAMFGFSSLATSIPEAPDGDTNLFAGADSEVNNRGAMLRSEYDLNKNLTAYANIGYLKENYKGFINGTRSNSTDALGNYTGRTYYLRGYKDAVSSEVGLRQKFTTGAIDHQMVLSAIKVDIESGTINKASATYASNIYDPVTPILATDPGAAPKTGENTLTSVALADTLSFNEDKYKLILGVRNQQVDSKSYSATTGALTKSYSKNAVTPAVAFVVKPWTDKSVSLYANYIEGLSAGETVSDTSADNYGEVLAPYKTKQSEIGVKWDAGQYANTLSVFQIKKPSAYLDSTTNIYDTNGMQRNQGVEWTTFGKISDNMRLLGGVTYMQGKLVETQNGKNEGNTVHGVPKWQANVGFEFDSTSVQGLSFNTRAVYTGSQFVSDTNLAKIPSWVRYDAGMQYKTLMQGNPATFRLNVENLLNKNYWSGTFNDGYLTVGNGRTYKLSMTIDI